jgi:hypothetical protein
VKNVVFLLFFSSVFFTKESDFKNRGNSALLLLLTFSFACLVPGLIHAFLGDLDFVVYSWRQVIIPPLFALCLIRIGVDDSFVGRVLMYFLASVILHAAYIILSYMLKINLASFEQVGPASFYEYSANGLANSHVMAGTILSLGTGLLIFTDVYKSKYIRYGVVLVLLTALYLTGSEGGVLSLLAASVSVFLVRRYGRPLIINSLMLVLGVLALFNIESYLDEVLFTSLNEHVVSIRFGYDLFVNNYLTGVGIDQSQKLFLENAGAFLEQGVLYGENLQPHNVMIRMAAELGVFGIIASLVLYIGVPALVGRGLNYGKYADALLFVVFVYMCASLIEPWPMVSNFYASYLFYISIVYFSSIKIERVK